MITLYTWSTPNGRKIPIMLEECGLPYTVVPVNIGKDEQFAPDFLKVSPNNKIPAIVDDEAEGGPLSVFESGAILTYLAEKTGRFLAPSGPARYKALEWLHWQMGTPGHQEVHRRGRPPVARHGSATERGTVPRRGGLLHRRHRLLRLDPGGNVVPEETAH
jgi:glutathione S-transferase